MKCDPESEAVFYSPRWLLQTKHRVDWGEGLADGWWWLGEGLGDGTTQGRAGAERRTSLLRRLQEQTLPDEAPPMGKIHPFCKIAATFEPVMHLGALRDLESPKKL